MKELSNDLLTQNLDELAAFEPNRFPFISLYLNARADQNGRDNFEPFVRKEFHNRAKTFAEDSPERESFKRDAGRIAAYLHDELKPSANGLAIFACAGANGFFKALQLAAPIRRNKLHVSNRPHLYPLARLIDQHPRFAAVIADTHAARLFVFDLRRTKSREELTNAGISRASAASGEWSQMRYRRRVKNYQQLHAREVVEMLERTVRDEAIEHIVLAGDEVIIPLLRERLPAHLAAKVIDVLRLDIRTPEHEILKAATEALRENDVQSDAEKVADLFDKYRAGGLAAVGLRETLDAVSRGQVDELLLAASLDAIQVNDEDDESEIDIPVLKAATAVMSAGAAVFNANEPTRAAMIADSLVSRARLSGAGVTFIEDPNLLAPVGGVGAFLRYRI